jgi:hypothetical protein
MDGSSGKTKISMTPRRWFRFSLRTFLLAVTVLGSWLGYQLNWIRERHAAFQDRRLQVARLSPPAYAPAAPQLLWLFGESGITGVYLMDPELTADDLRRLKSLFPEACVDWPAEE